MRLEGLERLASVREFFYDCQPQATHAAVVVQFRRAQLPLCLAALACIRACLYRNLSEPPETQRALPAPPDKTSTTDVCYSFAASTDFAYEERLQP